MLDASASLCAGGCGRRDAPWGGVVAVKQWHVELQEVAFAQVVLICDPAKLPCPQRCLKIIYGTNCKAPKRQQRLDKTDG